MIDNNEIEFLAEVPDAGTINTPVPGLVFADPVKWGLTLATLEGSLVEVLLAGGESTLGYIAGFADNTSPARCSKPAASGRNYTLDSDEPESGSHAIAPASAVVMVRKACASIARVMCRYQLS